MSEGSPSTGWLEVADAMEVNGEPEKPHDLEEFVDKKREDLEAIAEGDYPVSGVVQGLLKRVEEGA